MKCVNCGANLEQGDMFCANCGTPVKKETNINKEVQNKNMYMYERNESQQVNYNKEKPIRENYKNQANYTKNNNVNSNSSDIIKICMLTVITIVLIGGIAFGIYKMFGVFVNTNGKEPDSNENIGIGQTIENTSNGNFATNQIIDLGGATDSTSNNSNTVNNQYSSYKVNFDGFNLYIPNDLIYQIDYVNDMLNIGDVNQTWINEFGISKGSYQAIKQNKELLVTTLTQTLGENSVIGTPNIENIGGIEYITLECVYNGINVLIAYAGLNSMYTASSVIYNEDNNYNREYLNIMSSIISTAQYVGESQYLEVDETINLNKIKDAIEKVVE